MKITVRKMALTGLMAALTFVATAFIHINIPASTGYVNLGDSVILFAACFIDPYVGALAGVIGAVLGDLYVGAAYYVPFTIFAKLFEAIIAGMLFKVFKGKWSYFAIPIGSLAIVPTYALAYYLFGGWAMLWASSPFDLLQATFSSAMAIALVLILKKAKVRPLSEQ